MLRSLLEPDLRVPAVADIPLPALEAAGIRGVLLDLDNTVASWRGQEICRRAAGWLEEARRRSFRLCLVSNARRTRLLKVARELEIPCVPRANKPSRKALRRALEELELGPAEAAMVGDQLFTDVLAGNRLGLYTILVAPLREGGEQWWMRGVRRLERLASPGPRP